MNIGYTELLIVLAVALILFGAKRIPELAKALGQSVNAFKSGLKDEEKKPEGEKPAQPPKAG